MSLTPKEEAFCHHYVRLRNGTRAALEAGYVPNRAGRTAYELRKKGDVQNRISELEAEWRESSEVSPEQVIAELKALAFATPQQLLESLPSDPQMVLPLGDALLEAIRSTPNKTITGSLVFRKTEDGIEIRLPDKLSALSKLSDILGLSKVEISGSMQLDVVTPEAIAAARQLADAVIASREDGQECLPLTE
jgi:phage terminase small subunit